jgi:hypothetical protein
MKSITCAKCGIVFGLSDNTYHRLKEKGEEFFCPNGHLLEYKPSDNDKLKKEIKQLMAKLSNSRESVRYWNREYFRVSRSLSATKGVVTKMRKARLEF